MELSWLGRRVTVRRAVRHGDAVRYSDAVGDLIALDEDAAVIETRRGPVRIALGDVAIARLAPPSTADELALEAVAASGWRAAETAWMNGGPPSGGTSAGRGWLLRAAGGFTSRANSVLPLHAPGMPLDEALAAAGSWYAARGLPLRLQVPIEARRLLDAELGERGWEPSEDVAVLAARLDGLAGTGPSDPPGGRGADTARRVALAAAPDEGWLDLFRGGAARRSPEARELLVRHDRPAFASVRVNGATVAIGRGVVDGPWLGVSALEVDPARRRQGLATAIMTELVRWARTQGALRSYLQVATSDAAALALYARLGYWPHHAYRYRTAP